MGHNRGSYAKHIRKWLNCEWKRLGKAMLLRSPKIPYQENGCDCGVFVCRYAYSLFLMRNDKFTWGGGCERFLTLITKGPAFQFDMSDIARIREEMGILIYNLSIQYLKTKEQGKAKKRVKRKEIESSKRNKKIASSEMASEVAASGKEDGNSARTACDASDENSGSLTEAAVVAGMDKNGEEKENISQSQDNIVREIAAPGAPANSVQDSSDTVLSGEAANSISITGIAVGKAGNNAMHKGIHMGSWEEKENSSQSATLLSIMQEETEHVSLSQDNIVRESFLDTVLSGEATNVISGNEGVCSTTLTMASDKDGGTSLRSIALATDTAENRHTDMATEEKENISQSGARPIKKQAESKDIVSPMV